MWSWILDPSLQRWGNGESRNVSIKSKYTQVVCRNRPNRLNSLIKTPNLKLPTVPCASLGGQQMWKHRTQTIAGGPVDISRPHSDKKHCPLSPNLASRFLLLGWLLTTSARSADPRSKLVCRFYSVQLSTLKWPTLAQNFLKGKEVSILAHLFKAIFTCCYRFSRELDNILGSVTSTLINSWSIYLYGIFQPHFPIWAEESGKMPWIYPGNHKMDSAEWYWLKNSSPSGK